MNYNINKVIELIIDLYFNKEHYDFNTPNDLKVWLEDQLK